MSSVDRITRAKLDKIKKLEYEHARTFESLLKAVDDLYLAKQTGNIFTPNEEQERLLRTRRHFQMDMERSASLLRAFDHWDKTNLESETDGTAINGSKESPANRYESGEKILETRLQNLLHSNIDLDAKTTAKLKKIKELNELIGNRRVRFNELQEELSVLGRDLDARESRQYVDDDQHDTDIIKENEILQELLIALKVHSGNMQL